MLSTLQNIRSRVWLEVNLNTLEDNFHKIEKSVAPLKVLSVLKANAYGLGVEPIAKRLAEAGTAGFCVAELKEALPLIPFGKPIQILGGILDFEIPPAVENGIILGITDVETARKISAEAVRQNKIQECHFKLDTGMGRLGILSDHAMEVIDEVLKLPNLNCCGIYSHFPTAYRGEDSFSFKQVQKFMGILDACWAKGIRFEKIHIANSDAINNCPFAKHFPFNYVRTGINLHGSFDNEGQRCLDLKSILTLKTHVAAVRELPAGYSIGYGCTCRLVKNTFVGTISAGYADGLPLNLSNRGYVLIHGKLCPILGRLSMDYTTVSLDAFLPGEVQKGDEAICLGGNGLNEITVENWAQIKGTHPYDVICSIGNRVERVYIQ